MPPRATPAPVPGPPTPPVPVAPPAYVPPAPPIYTAPPYTPPVAPTYPYSAAPYAYAQPAPRSGPSGVLIGVVALLVVLVVGVGLMFALHLGPFAVAEVSPTPAPTETQTVAPTATPVPPTDTAPPTASAPPVTEPPTATPALVSPTPGGGYDYLWAVVPPNVAGSCVEDTEHATPRLFCFILPQGISFWYEAFPDQSALTDEYDGWLTFRAIGKEVANCFDVPTPLPCEGPYKVGDFDPAGRIAAWTDKSDGWIYWRHDPALVFGTGLVTIDETHSFGDLFSYWKSDASGLDFSSTPTP